MSTLNETQIALLKGAATVTTDHFLYIKPSMFQKLGGRALLDAELIEREFTPGFFELIITAAGIAYLVSLNTPEPVKATPKTGKKLSGAQIKMLEDGKAENGVRLFMYGEETKVKRGDKLVDLGLMTRTTGRYQYGPGSFWIYKTIAETSTTEAQPAADDIEPEAPTEATLGDELYEESAPATDETYMPYTVRVSERIILDFVVENDLIATELELIAYAEAQGYISDPQHLMNAFINMGGTLLSSKPVNEITPAKQVITQDEMNTVMQKIGYSSFAPDIHDTYTNNVISALCNQGLAKRVMVSNTTPFYALTWKGQDELKALIEPAPEPTGPARNADERAAMNTFDEGYNYLGMTPKERAEAPNTGEIHPFSEGDKVMGPHGIATVRVIFGGWSKCAHICYENGTIEFVRFDMISAYIDPRDAEIEQLKAENAALKAQQGLFPVRVYNAYLDTQDTRLSQVPYAQACMRLKDVMSAAIVNRPTGYPIVQGDC